MAATEEEEEGCCQNKSGRKEIPHTAVSASHSLKKGASQSHRETLAGGRGEASIRRRSRKLHNGFPEEDVRLLGGSNLMVAYCSD